MGICAIQHRTITGKYNSNFNVCNFNTIFNKVRRPATEINSCGMWDIVYFIYYVSMVYIMSLIMALCIEISLNQTSCRSYPMKFSFNIPASEISPTILIILLILHLLKTTKNTNPLTQIKTVFCLNTKKYLYFFYSRAAQYTYWVACLNLFLIVICNPVILNPGTIQGNSKLSVFFIKM